MRQRIVTLCLLVLTFMAGSYVTYLVLDARNTNIEVPGYREKLLLMKVVLVKRLKKYMMQLY